MRRLVVLFVLLVAAAAVVRVLGAQPATPRIEGGSERARGSTVVRWALQSRAAGGRRAQVGVIPPGEGRRPLLVLLHGRGRGGEEASLDPAFVEALGALGRRAPAVVFPNGGEASFWHARSSGDWPRYVLDEVIPQAARRLGADPRRVAIGGISMGGFGAYNIARQAPRRFCAVGGHSAALWLSAGETASGAFDDAEDFRRHDLVAFARRHGRAGFGGVPLWLDAGADDPFVPGGRALAQALGLTLRQWPGGHERAYWRRHYDDYLRFYAGALTACRR